MIEIIAKLEEKIHEGSMSSEELAELLSIVSLLKKEAQRTDFKLMSSIRREKDARKLMEAIIEEIETKKNQILEINGRLQESQEELKQTNEELLTLNNSLSDANQLIRKKNKIIRDSHKNILDSIDYAKNIQDAILVQQDVFNSVFSDAFVLFKPKQTVSGDFYYLNSIKEKIVFAVADCTGHGVPGGFLTMLGISYLHEIIRQNEDITAAQILTNLRSKIKETFRVFGAITHNGLDIALCILDPKTLELQYAGAFNPLWLNHNGALSEIKATPNPIGLYYREVDFEDNNIQLEEGDILYMFSDGFSDQLGGKKDKKYKKRPFRDFIKSIANKSLSDQRILLDTELKRWKGSYSQTDDITILGVKV